jgi:hypothetical protein
VVWYALKLEVWVSKALPVVLSWVSVLDVADSGAAGSDSDADELVEVS